MLAAALAADAADAFTVSSHNSSSSSGISAPSSLSGSPGVFGSFGERQALFGLSMNIFPAAEVLVASFGTPAHTHKILSKQAAVPKIYSIPAAAT